MDKKGFTFFGNIIIIPLVILIIIIFAVIMSFFDMGELGDKEEIIELNKNIEFSEDKYIIINYLRTPLDVEMDIVDLIYLWDDQTDLWDTLKSETENIFSKVYGNCYGLKIGNQEIGSFNDKKSSCVILSNGIDICLDISEYNEFFEKNKAKEKCFP
jgi:hypothetical protein